MKKGTGEFQLGEGYRIDFINKFILPGIPDDKKAYWAPKILGMVERYEGQDIHALVVMAHSLKRGEEIFYNMFEKLEEFESSTMKDIKPKDRRKKDPGNVISDFFHQRYKDLGIFQE